MKFFTGTDAKTDRPVRVSEAHLKRWPDDVKDPVEVGKKASAAAEEPKTKRRSAAIEKE